MTAPEGGFYSAQDADSEGVEGKYYLFDSEEIIEVLGEEAGKEFNQHFNVTDKGNFEGKNIPNLLHNNTLTEQCNDYLPTVYEYRKKRYSLHLDDKILTSWNALMIAAMCHLYRVTGKEVYKAVAKKVQEFIEKHLCENDTLYVSYRNGMRSKKGFLDDMEMPDKITIVVKDRQELADLSCKIPLNTVVCIIEEPTKEYPLKNNRTTFYMCKGHSCFQPSNELLAYSKYPSPPT